MRACGSRCLSCIIFVRVKESVIRSGHVIPLLVFSTSSHFSSTTARRTTWTARSSPRRHSKPTTTSARTSSGLFWKLLCRKATRGRKAFAKMGEYIFQRASKAGSCSCQLSTTVYGMRMKKLVKISQKEWKNTLEDFLAVIGLSFFLVKKRSGTPHTIANQTDPGIGPRRRRCKIPKGLVTQYSVVPVRW